MSNYHTSVLLEEVLEYLNISENKRYIDATLGGGGHSLEIIKRGGVVLGIDADKEAIDFVHQNFKFEILNLKLKLAQGNFRNLREIAHLHGFEKVDGILFDLGVSSHQLDTKERGFSFQKEAPLDMRMGSALGVTAADLINGLGKNELLTLFKNYGEEPFAHAIARRIVEQRKIKPIQTTLELVDIIKRAVGRNYADVHPATRVFQALRIAVNDELNSLAQALPQAFELLEKNGRIVIISFHSLEDRIVKNYFKEKEEEGKATIVTKKPVVSSGEEIDNNKRARSAKLRVLKKL